MKFSILFRTVPTALLGIVISFCLTALPAMAQTKVETLFELDGNTIDESLIGAPDDIMPPDDWAWGDNTGSWDYVAGPYINANPPPLGDAFVSSYVPDKNGDTGEDDIFHGGGSKDDLPIKEGYGSNGWKWTIGTPPDKTDLLDVGAAAYVPVLGELLIYDFGSLYAANGTSSIGNWFFKKDIGPCVGGPHDGKFGIVDSNLEGRPCLDEQPDEPLHSIGDILIISENTNGGKVTNISVYRWIGNVQAEIDECEADGHYVVPPKDNLCLVGEFANATCDGDPDTNPYACGVMNQVATESPDTWEFQSKFPVDGLPAHPLGTDGIDTADIPALSFLESGINISEILEETECFSSFMKNTRTSAKPRSELKDFASGAFELCGIEVVKNCVADLNDAGDRVDVVFSGDLTNTGVVDLEIVLADSEEGSEITKVCYDTNDTTGVCDESDEVPDDLEFVDGGAAFTLDAGRQVLYEGTYAFSGQLTSITFTDTIMAVARLGEKVVDTAEDDASCEIDPDPGIAVTKNCSPSFVNGDTFTAKIYGNIENTGNVTLVDVELTDTVFAPSELTLWFDTNANYVVDSGESLFNNGVDDLVAHDELAYIATFTSTSVTNHTNTVTAKGYNFFDTSEEWKAEASTSCKINPKPDLGITKVCDPSIGSGSPDNGTGVQLKEHAGFIVVEVGNIITVTNTGNEDMNVFVSDSEADLVAPTGWTASDDSCPNHDPDDFNCVTGLLQAGIPDPGDGSNQIEIQRLYIPDDVNLNIIGVLSDPGSVKFVNTATASGAGVLSKEAPLGSPFSATAECKICPDCPACPQ